MFFVCLFACLFASSAGQSDSLLVTHSIHKTAGPTSHPIHFIIIIIIIIIIIYLSWSWATC